MSNDVNIRAALRELVRLKAVHDRYEELGRFGCPPEHKEEFDRLVKDYSDNKAKAWETARALLLPAPLSGLIIQFPDCPLCDDNLNVYRGADGKLRCKVCHD